MKHNPGLKVQACRRRIVSEPARRPQQVLRPLLPARGHRRHRLPGELRRPRRYRRWPPPPDIGDNISILHTALILNEMREMRDPGCDNDTVSPTPAQQARAARIAAEITARLADVAFALPGTLADRMTRCGHPGCRCRADPPRPHGPYHQWTRKKDGKTATRILTDDQLADYAPWFDNHRRLRELVTELEELSLAIAEADPRWNR
jgi:hypothetical protein